MKVISIFLIAIVSMFGISCNSSLKTNEKDSLVTAPSNSNISSNNLDMQKLLTNTNPKEFKAIDSLIEINQIKTAEDQLIKLIQKFESNGQWDGYIRAIMTMANIKARQENGDQEAIQYLESTLTKAQSPTKEILFCLTAMTYNSYLDFNRYKINSITDGANVTDENDFTTWSLQKFNDKIRQYYSKSIENERIKEIPISDINLLTTPANTDEYRPSLFDFLSHQMLDYLIDDRNYVTEPVYKFVVKGEQWFAPIESFATMEIASRDSTSNVLNSLQIYQRLIQNHLEKGNQPALHRINLDRLNFVYSHSSDPLKARYFKDALHSIITSEPDNVYKASYQLRAINLDLELDSYSVDDPDQGNRYLLSDVIQQLQTLITQYPNSESAIKAKNKITELNTPAISIQSESVQLPGEPFLMLANYKNLNEAKIIVYKISPEQYMKTLNEGYNRTFKQYLLKGGIFKTIPATLPKFDDFRTHNVEFKVDALEEGLYIFCTEPLINADSDIHFSTIQVSSLSVLDNNQYGNINRNIAVVDRKSGLPLVSVLTQIYSYNYNNQRLEQIGKTKSNNQGFIDLTNVSNNNFICMYSKGKDTLVDTRYNYNYPYRRNYESRIQANIFTDRAIYRPGQIVYFKAIMYQMDENALPSIVPNKKVTITLRDVNQQEVAKGKFTTNEFGSINGNFTIPSGVLTGSMSLHIDENYGKTIQVEEYKRPKFEVLMDTITQAYVLKDKIKISGKALYYAGNPADGAQVTYTVSRKRQQRYLWWDYGYFRPNFNSNEMIISNGELTTKPDGSFEINFDAIPDESIDKKSNPQFIFAINIDVTDINGETQSKLASLILGYEPYSTVIKLPINSTAEDLKKLAVATYNSAGVSVITSGKLKIELLTSPTGYLRNKMYATPEAVNIPKEEYKKLWPFESYLNESDKSIWKVEKTLFDQTIQSGDNPIAALNSIQFPKGEYRITFDIAGQKPLTSKQAFYTTISNPSKSLDFNLNDLILAETDKKAYQVGDISHQSYKSRNPSGKLLYEFFVKNKLISREWLDASSAIKKSIEINRQYLGGVNTVITAYGFSRVQSKSVAINVPWTEKELNIKLKTFRDKLNPGQEEVWEFIISGQGKEKVAAEVLASMYDASLDVFTYDSYTPIPFPNYYTASRYVDNHNQIVTMYKNFKTSFVSEKIETVRTFLPNILVYWYHGLSYENGDINIKQYSRKIDSRAAAMESLPSPTTDGMAEKGEADKSSSEQVENTPDASQQTSEIPPIRKNLEETVFFYPNLYTDKDGNVILQFKMKEALTKWKLRIFAHTKDLQQGTLENTVTTSKDLMVFPNLPRYFRENDDIELTAKITNMNGLSGIVKTKLELVDAITMEPLSTHLFVTSPEQSVPLSAGQSSVVSWKIHAPSLPTEAVTVRITAQTEQHADGEENTLPVLSNRMLVTETMPMMIRKGTEKSFTFNAMNSSLSSATATPYRYTLEYSSNPAWYAVQALPYMMEYPYECTEQILNRYYANTLAAYIANSNPKIKAVFEKWKNSDALLSNLQKNEELKSALLQETPWVLDAQSEAQQKKNIGLLFDFNKMASEQKAAMRKIVERQYQNGGLPWFPGCRDNEYVTSYAIENIGHLYHLGVVKNTDADIENMLQKALTYCDLALNKAYEEIKKNTKGDKKLMEADNLYYWPIQYLYARSLVLKADKHFIQSEAYQYFFNQSKKYWNKKNQYAQGMIALYLARNGEKITSNLIVEGLKQTAFRNDNLGMYWNSPRGYFWYMLPTETQAMMIEVFAELTNETDLIDEMKLWLLTNKQTNNWNTTKATSSAIYALLINGGVMNLETVWPDIHLGKTKFDIASTNPESGTGYFKKSYTTTEIKPDFANIKVKNNASVVNWGASYFQYYEQMDKIKSFQETPLTIDKAYHIVQKTDKGEKLIPITQGQKIKVGDKIRVQTIIRVDRPMEFVHLKDMRPAGTEPIQSISGYRYKGGLGYYQSIKDVAANFFMDYLPKGTFVFEYDIRASLRGDFSTGISTIQCMYAPEFSSHSKGERMKIE